jgi:fibronectin type 3 domain-containing protein
LQCTGDAGNWNTPIVAPPAAPAVTVISATVSINCTTTPPVTTHSVSLTWAASTSTVAGYNVYRSLVSGSGYSKLNTALLIGLGYVDAAVTAKTTYFYVATAVDASGHESVHSNEASAVLP